MARLFSVWRSRAVLLQPPRTMASSTNREEQDQDSMILRRVNSRKASILILSAALLAARVLAAQDTLDIKPLRGVVPTGTYALSDIETISMQSGAVMLRIPIATLPPARAGQ